MLKKNIIFVVGLMLLLGGFVTVADASHSWGKYHWNISTDESMVNPLELGNNLNTSAWNSSLVGASSDWNISVLKNQIATEASNTNCDPTIGKVEICNDKYGNNDWLGIASIWVTRGRSGHIVQGVVKVNDTYFNTAYYNTPAWRNLVMCQEVGHTFGLGHQDEDFTNTNLGTCMDYTNDPDGKLSNQLDNQSPNRHDYDMMTEMYAHLNSTDSGSGPGPGPGNGKGGGKGKPKKAGVRADIDLNDPSAWGRAIKQDARGNDSLFERNLENGEKLVTFVIWADDEVSHDE